MNNLRTSPPLSSCKNLPPILFMVHLLHRLYGVDAPVLLYTTLVHNKAQNSSDNLPSYRIIQIITNLILCYIEWLRINVCLQLMLNFMFFQDKEA